MRKGRTDTSPGRDPSWGTSRGAEAEPIPQPRSPWLCPTCQTLRSTSIPTASFVHPHPAPKTTHTKLSIRPKRDTPISSHPRPPGTPGPPATPCPAPRGARPTQHPPRAPQTPSPTFLGTGQGRAGGCLIPTLSPSAGCPRPRRSRVPEAVQVAGTCVTETCLERRQFGKETKGRGFSPPAPARLPALLGAGGSVCCFMPSGGLFVPPWSPPGRSPCCRCPRS